MRQVDRDELAYALANALRGLPASTRHQFSAGTLTQQTRARALIGYHVADRIGRFEILSSGDLPMTMREKAFSTPLANMLGGQEPPEPLVPPPGVRTLQSMTTADKAVLEIGLAIVSAEQVARRLIACQPESEERDFLAGEMERRNIDD